MKIKKTSEPTWIPMFIDGDNDSGWVIVFENSVTKELRDSSHIFDTKKEARECFKNGGEMPEAYNKTIEDCFGQIPQYH